MENSQFTHLHVHTEFSLLDGACRIDKMMGALKEMGQTSVAITDHGVMFGTVDFYNAAKSAGIKPIIGCEVYVATRTRFDKVNKIDYNNHLVLLCKNETGYKNLIKMVSRGFTEGFYSKPRIDFDLLKKHSEGLICLSACLAGEVPRALLAGDYEKAKEIAKKYSELFGKDNYYIEIQDHGIEEQKVVLPRLVALANEMGLPLVATNDAHYVTKQDSKMQRVLVCIQTNKMLDDEDVLEFGTDEFYLKSTQEMFDLFGAYEGACENTNKIAQMCNFDFEFGVTKLPYFKAPSGIKNEDYLRQICYDGLHKHYGDAPKDIVDRMEYEISVIINMGYTNYFLIVYDFINYAKTKGIPVGPGRGSGAGSICAYSMGITNIDPIKYNLLFERFLNPERISMPDFDIDFCYERRQEVINYVIDKYGSDHVAQIVTFGTMGARLAIRDVGRVMGIQYQVVDEVAKLIPNELKMTLQKALSISKELNARYSSDMQVKELIDVAIKIEGMPRHASTHAAGVVITREEVDAYVPLSTNDGNIVTQFPMTTIENLGLLKMDFLGLRTLTVISDAEKMVKKHTPDFSIDDVLPNDVKTFELLASGATSGVFQLESSGMRQVIVGLKPTNLEDIIAVISLYRPGPMDSIPTYIHNRHNPEKIMYKTKLLEKILGVTNGCIVYQEQVMQICRELAGFSYGQADLVRRAMSKKKHSEMEKARNSFINGSTEKGNECVGCVKNGISSSVANAIFDEMSSFASYAFNKSHAAAYALVAYQTAYLKAHYVHEFMAALLTSVLENSSKVIEYTSECANLGINILPPDINKSELGFTVENGNLRFGLLALKNVGRGLIASVILNRKDGPYIGLYDFCKRLFGMELNRKAVESLVKAGAFDSIDNNRRMLVENLDNIVKSIETEHRKNIDGQMNLFEGFSDAAEFNTYKMQKFNDYEPDIRLQFEKEISGLYLSGHPLEQYRGIINKISSCNILSLLDENAISYDNKKVCVVCTVVKTRTITTRSGGLMAFVTVEDLSGIIEVLVFPKVLEQYSPLIRDNAIVIIEGTFSFKEDEDSKILADKIREINDAQPTKLAKDTKTSKHGLWLKIKTRKGENFDNVCNLLKIFEGDTPVYFYVEDEKRRVLAPKSLWCNYGSLLCEELEKAIGADNVKYVAE